MEFIQFDGEWDECWTHAIGGRMYRELRALSPTLMINSRVDKGRHNPEYRRTHTWNRNVYAGDFEDHERVVNYGNDVYGYAAYPWQAWVTIDTTQWSYNPRSEKRLLSSRQIIEDLVKVICDNGNYMINLGPRPDGTFDPDEAAILREAGQWIRSHGGAIYGTRGGPWYSGDWGGSTRKGSTVFLFPTKSVEGELLLAPPTFEIVSVTTWDGEEVAFRRTRKRFAWTCPLHAPDPFSPC